MKIQTVLIFASLFLPNILLANAKVVGNGGDVVVCTAGLVTTLETLDLFEGRAIYNLSYKEDPSPALSQALRYADQISAYLGSPISAKNLSADVRDVYDNLHFLPSGVGLAPVDDIANFVVPKNCQIVQTINYRDWKKLFVDSDIWNALSETQKAALILHEAIYAFYRAGASGFFPETTSVRARHAVAALLSGAAVESVDKPKDLKGDTYLHCSTDDGPVSEFFHYQDTAQNFVTQFRYLADHIALTRTWISSVDPKLSVGDVTSPFEDGVRVQLNFASSTKGEIYYSSMPNIGPKKFTCETWHKR